jgi:hypothetical protein
MVGLARFAELGSKTNGSWRRDRQSDKQGHIPTSFTILLWCNVSVCRWLVRPCHHSQASSGGTATLYRLRRVDEVSNQVRERLEPRRQEQVVRFFCGLFFGLLAGVLLAPGTQVRLHRFVGIGDATSLGPGLVIIVIAGFGLGILAWITTPRHPQ